MVDRVLNESKRITKIMSTVADQFIEILAMWVFKRITLYMVKAVIGGRAGEVLDLAVTNLWR
jgi:hypothetical protein